MTDQLLTVKLFAPPPRPGLVQRTRLLHKLDQGLEQGRGLTLVSAPAGYGKTTLVVEWLQRLDRPSGWLSLERSDNHPLQFLTYLIAALQQVDRQIGDSVLAGLDSPDGQENPAQWLRIQLARLINEISAVPGPFVLVLDDYHTITELAVHQAIEFLVDHQPAQMHLVITTRQDPLLPLSRYRSRSQVTEIRLGDLRFTMQEAAVFLNETMRLDLVPEQIASLDARTEGWIAGLQLAALSLSEIPAAVGSPLDPAGRSEFIRAFAGDDRHVVDYLMDEVLSRQPEEVQRFLLYTSVLKRLSGPLCDAVIEPGDWKMELGEQPAFSNLQAPFPSQGILEHLDAANLFIIPLDNRRQWYRYHHLFADLLNSRLQSADPEQVSRLHCRASQWYERAELTAEAVDHALLAEDFNLALRLIEQSALPSIWASGELPVLLNWSKRLPEDVLMSRPRLSLYYARALFFAGQVDSAEGFIRGAEATLRSRPKADPASDELWGILYTNQATFAAMRGDPDAALDLARRAKSLLPLEDVSSHARIAHATGVAQDRLGCVREAEQAFSQAVQLSQAANNHILGLDVVACLALTRLKAGRLRQAAQVCDRALSGPDYPRIPAACAVYLAKADVLYEKLELQGALEALQTSIELARQAGWYHILWRAYALLSLVKQALGDPSGAREAIQQSGQAVQRYNIPWIARLFSAYQARLDLAQGELGPAQRWAAEYQQESSENSCREFEYLVLVRVYLALNRIDEALGVLDSLLPSAQSGGRLGTLIEALALKSLVLEAQGEHDGSRSELERALALAEPDGFARIFAEAGGRAFPPAAPKSSNSTQASTLVEPLSQRELEVLHLVAEGLSNPEIAARLYLSVNTLRAHTSNIYGKLGVHNRLQAVTRARELGLLPD